MNVDEYNLINANDFFLLLKDTRCLESVMNDFAAKLKIAFGEESHEKILPPVKFLSH